MRILLANSIRSFEDAPQRTSYSERLAGILTSHGHQVDRFTLPFVPSPKTLIDQVMSYRLLDVTASADRLIAFDAPAYLLQHSNKAVVITSLFKPLAVSETDELSALKSFNIDRYLEHASLVALSEAKAIYFQDDEARLSAEMQLEAFQLSGVSLNGLRVEEEVAIELATGVSKQLTIRTKDKTARRVA